MDTLSLVRRQASDLLRQVERAGYDQKTIDDEQVHEVIGVLEAIQAATSPDDIPRQVGGTLFFFF